MHNNFFNPDALLNDIRFNLALSNRKPFNKIKNNWLYSATAFIFDLAYHSISNILYTLNINGRPPSISKRNFPNKRQKLRDLWLYRNLGENLSIFSRNFLPKRFSEAKKLMQGPDLLWIDKSMDISLRFGRRILDFQFPQF